MPTETAPAANTVNAVEMDRAKVTRIRIGKRGRAIELDKGLLKKAGWRPGARLQATVMSDGTVVLRREPATTTSQDALFEKCAPEVLAERRQLLERLAK
jgi:hypothetical protein